MVILFIFFEYASEEIEMEAVKNFDYNYHNNDFYIKYCIRSKKAKQLYEKLKEVHGIIK